MADFSDAFVATETSVPTYFFESTAPNNVDDNVASNRGSLAGYPIEPIDDPQRAIERSQVCWQKPQTRTWL